MLVATTMAAGLFACVGCSAGPGAPATVTVAADAVTVTKSVSSTVTVTATVTAAPVTVTEDVTVAVTSDSITPTAAPSSSQVAESTAGSGLTAAQQAAVSAARSYLGLSGFSRQGLIDQLSSEYGDKFLVEDATAAVDSLDVDWNAEATESASRTRSCRGSVSGPDRPAVI